MEEILNIDLPGFKASYKVKWYDNIDFDSLKNVKQANGILFNDEGKILIVNVVGNWQLPGGHIEKGESYEGALGREISEEGDVETDNVIPLGHLKVNEIKEGILKPEFIQIYYLGKIIKINKQTIDPAHNKIAERKFIEPEEFTDYIPWGGIGKEIISKAKKNFLEKRASFVAHEASDYARLDFMSPLKEFFKFKEDINKFMNEVHPSDIKKDYLKFVSRIIRYEDVSEEIKESIIMPNWDMLNRPKSYLRPFIFLLIIGGLGENPKNYIKYSALLELIHNGTLIHDDIEDNAQVRRGDKPLYLKYGLDRAVNSANLLYFTPFLMFRRYPGDFPDLIKIRAYDCLIEHLNRVTWGQGLDILWHNNKKIPTIKEYLQMCCYKTGAIDRMVFSLAGILAKTDNAKKELLEDFGEEFGICLQIHDDFCDICSVDRTKIGGKVKGNDISEGKKSIVNIIALTNLDGKDKELLLDILSEHTSDPIKIESALNLIEKSKSLLDVLNLAKKEFNHLKGISRNLLNKKYSDMMNSFLDAMEEDMMTKYSTRRIK